jgi:hypothetical protein
LNLAAGILFSSVHGKSPQHTLQPQHLPSPSC